MKRVLLFLLLLGAGIGALWLVVANDTSSSASGNSSATTVPRDDGAEQSPESGGIQLPGGASLTLQGPQTFPHLRSVPLGDGRSRLEEVFVLNAKDSRYVGEGVTRLDGVTVTLFDNGKHVATLAAPQAFAALKRDANGRLSLSEDKEVDLRDAVLTGVEGGRLRGLRLELGDAKIRVTEDDALLTTARDQPVAMFVAGERPLTLRGKGAVARLPRERAGSAQRAEVEIVQDPVIEMRDTTVRARGPLHYAEDMRTGLAQVTVANDVQLDATGTTLALPGVALPDGDAERTGNESTIVRGDRFVGWLQRERETGPDGRERQQVAWRHIELTGAPATAETLGTRVSTSRLTAVPGLSGEPFLVTAHGPSRVEETVLPANKRRKTLAAGSAEHALHVVRLGEYVGASHRALGFPRWTLGPLEQTVVIGEGPSRLTSDRRIVDASRGIRLFRREGSHASTVQGLGDVGVRQRGKRAGDEDVIATGNGGFVMNTVRGASASDQDTTPDTYDVRLGPAATAPGGGDGTAFDVRQGEARVTGHGTCEVVQIGDDTRAHVVSKTADIVATLPAEGVELRHVHELRTRLRGEEVIELEADGWPNELSLSRDKDDEKVVARAPRIVQIGPRSLRLLPVPDGAARAAWPIGEQDVMPRVRRTARRHADLPLRAADELVEVRGPEIDVHHAGGNTVLVECNAKGSELAHLYANVPHRDHAEPTTIACDAERLRLMPFVLTADVRAFHADTRGAFADVMFHSLGRPWLIVDGVRDFQLDDARQGHVAGRGRRVLVSQGGRAALFVGDPATGEPAEVRRIRDGRDVTLRGPRVRVFDADAVRLDALDSFEDGGSTLLPTMTLHEAGKTDLLSHVRATCRGKIEVLPEEVVFGGPVVAIGLRPDGSDDPDGIHLDARDLRLLRDGDSDTHDVVSAFAKDVTLRTKQLDAKGAEMEIDVKQRRIIVRDPNDAVVELSNGFRYVAPRLAVDYEKLAVHSFHGRVTRRDDTTGGRR